MEFYIEVQSELYLLLMADKITFEQYYDMTCHNMSMFNVYKCNENYALEKLFTAAKANPPTA